MLVNLPKFFTKSFFNFKIKNKQKLLFLSKIMLLLNNKIYFHTITSACMLISLIKYYTFY